MKTASEILNEVDEMVRKPFVTARFGDHWKEHTKKMIDEGQMTVEMVLEIAWKQGRKAILLEDVIRKLLPTE
jgi:hypothetical protein